jgi:preprotein translocase subunit SecA
MKANFDEALAEIEEIQLVGYLAKILQEPYDIDYNEIVHVQRLVRGGFLGEARIYLDEKDKDVALVEELLRLTTEYSQYQAVQNDPGKMAQFLSETYFEKHYNARAALVRAVLADELDEAEEIADETAGLSRQLITDIEELKAQTIAEHEEVRRLGGLHVIGSERHESRRIDNQLRGRAARQGDPGSSRFFLSLEDDLMRRFGGERLKSWMNRGVMSNIPEDMPLEFSVLDRIIENSQERIEGFNFDMRKNVVEYDDVMSRQRQSIYSERRAILMGESLDLDDKVDKAFADAIAELVDHYVDNYIPYVQGELDRAIAEYSTDATDTINANGVVMRVRGLLPGVMQLDRAELAELSANELSKRLMEMAYDNEEDGLNLQQLLQAMGRFLPLLATPPNLGTLATRRSGQLQARETMKRNYLEHVEMFYNDFLAKQIEHTDRDRIWSQAEAKLEKAFGLFNVDGLTTQNAPSRQLRFKMAVDVTVRDLLLESLSSMESQQLIDALIGYVKKQQAKWRENIGEEEYRNFQRLLLLEAIDREWRDYLTAMDDLRREIGLEAVGQRDPKVQYKLRSAEMYMDMRHNIEKDIVDRFFRQIASHQAYVAKQEQEKEFRTNSQEAGFQVVKRQGGKGTELRRDAPKVGRNDPCPCGSGKKYKQCHGRKAKAKRK